MDDLVNKLRTEVDGKSKVGEKVLHSADKHPKKAFKVSVGDKVYESTNLKSISEWKAINKAKEYQFSHIESFIYNIDLPSDHE